LRELAELYDAAAVVTVGCVPGDEDEQGAGHELHEPDHAEIERAAGELIDLPADGDGGDLPGEFGKAPRRHIEQQRLVAE